MPKNAFAVILAGGRGQRFWPLSTTSRPKQLMSLFGQRPLLGMAREYLGDLIPPERTFVITNAALVRASREALPELPPENVIGEPVGRDTAAACALASALVGSRDPDAAFCILTADHVIEDLDLFRATLGESLQLAQRREVLITIGIEPSHPSTGFGYIEAGDRAPTEGQIEFFAARRFVEKPDRATAEQYIARGNFFWNSGMFVWSVRAIQSALRQHRPELCEMARRLSAVAGTDALAKHLEAEYATIGRISIDYAVMEKASNILMAKGRFRWDDVGSWPAIANHIAKNADGSVVVGRCESIDAEGNVVVSRERLTALIGVKDLVVVQAPHATLICPKDRAQDVKKMVDKLESDGKYRELL